MQKSRLGSSAGWLLHSRCIGVSMGVLALVCANSALALQVGVCGPHVGCVFEGVAEEMGTKVGETVVFVVALDQEAVLNGYELFISYDPAELSPRFTSAETANAFPDGTGLDSLPFTVAPDSSALPATIRVSALSLEAAPTTTLFRVEFMLVADLADGEPDFTVRKGYGGLGGNPPLQIDNPVGAAIDIVPFHCSLGALLGDANRDGSVDGADYTLWADHFEAESASWEQGDFNCDGRVDGADYTVWADNFGTGR